MQQIKLLSPKDFADANELLFLIIKNIGKFLEPEI
jgi:hypothetical protein